MQPFQIRFVKPSDAAALLAIYAPYVRKTAITFEYEVPSVEQFAVRIRQIQEGYPYLAAMRGGKIIGYAYAHAFGVRAAYTWSAEASVYVARSCRRQGVGRALYEALERILRQMNVTNLNVAIAVPDADDEFLTRDSVQFHRSMGYATVGEFHNCGNKFGRWYNIVWMEKFLAPHETPPLPLKNVNTLLARGEILL